MFDSIGFIGTGTMGSALARAVSKGAPQASLFLSMLPLHLDNPQKVFGFLLNGMEILKEVGECLKE